MECSNAINYTSHVKLFSVLTPQMLLEYTCDWRVKTASSGWHNQRDKATWPEEHEHEACSPFETLPCQIRQRVLATSAS